MEVFLRTIVMRHDRGSLPTPTSNLADQQARAASSERVTPSPDSRSFCRIQIGKCSHHLRRLFTLCFVARSFHVVDIAHNNDNRSILQYLLIRRIYLEGGTRLHARILHRKGHKLVTRPQL